jgi:signal transduction histidine kinase
MVATLGRRAEALQTFTLAYRRISQLPEPVVAMVDLSELFSDLGRLFEGKWRDTVKLELETPESSFVRADANQLTQALWALLQNAAEASLAADEPRKVALTAELTEDIATLKVSNTGPAVPPEHAEAIFNLFFTTKADGSGIGLALAKQIARAHGGDLVLEQAAPTCFLFTVPRQSHLATALDGQN